MDLHAVDGQRIVTLIGADETAHLLRVDRSTITRWVKSGKLKSLGEFGGALVFAREDIEELATELGAA
jgi:excisionase family DNA binding protein